MTSVLEIAGHLQKGNQSSILSITVDTIFTVAATIAIFILGYVVNRLIEQSKETKRLTELEGYFRKLIDLIEEPLLKQKDALLQLTKQLKEKKEQHYNVADVTSFRMDLIKNVSNQDLYRIFISRKSGKISRKTELFRKLIGQIDYLEEVKKSIKESFHDLMKRSDMHVSKYNENIKVTSEAFDQMVVYNRASGAGKSDRFLLNLDAIRDAWVRSGSDDVPFQDRYIAVKNYLDPVKELCQANIGDQRAAFLLKHILECRYAFDNIEEVRYVYRRHFLLDARGMQTAMIQIKKALDEFCKMGNRRERKTQNKSESRVRRKWHKTK